MNKVLSLLVQIVFFYPLLQICIDEAQKFSGFCGGRRNFLDNVLYMPRTSTVQYRHTAGQKLNSIENIFRVEKNKKTSRLCTGFYRDSF